MFYTNSIARFSEINKEEYDEISVSHSTRTDFIQQTEKIQGFRSPLTELGIQQAAIAGKHVLDLDLKFDDAYSSTSERACDTLELIADVPYKRIKGLREWNFGDLEAEGEHLIPHFLTAISSSNSEGR